MAFVGSGRGRGMKGVELYAQVRFAVQIKGLSRREAARQFGIDQRTVAKMLCHRWHRRNWRPVGEIAVLRGVRPLLKSRYSPPTGPVLPIRFRKGEMSL